MSASGLGVCKSSLALVALTVFFCGCSHHRKIGADDLRSELTAGISTAAEAQSLIDYILQGRSTNSYAKGHLQYLFDEARRSAKEVGEATPETSVERLLPQCRQEFDALAEQVREARSAVNQPEQLRHIKENLSKLQSSMERTMAAL